MAKRFIIHEQKQINSAVEHIKKLELGGQHEIIVRKFVKKRSDDQNRLYFKLLELISKETGHDKDSLHEYFKKRYGIWDVEKIFGEEIPVPLSTTKYGTKKFSEYMTQVEAEAASLGIVLPHPNDWMTEDGIFLQ